MRQRTELRQQHKQEFNARFSAAIQVLQMPAAELAVQIRDALDTNPMLEEFEAYELDGPGSLDLPTDSPPSTTTTDSGVGLEYAAEIEETETVRDHLLRHLLTSGYIGTHRIIAQAIIDSIDERGYLVESVEELEQLLAAQVSVSVDQIESVLKTVQQFGPPGIGARNLAESLSLQLDCSAADAATVACAQRILRDCLSLLSENKIVQIAEQLKVDATLANAAVALIRALNPYPGYRFGNAAEAILPDLITRKVNDRWQVWLNPETLPNIRISNDYVAMMRRIDRGAGQQYLKKSLSSANSFLENVNRRHETILRVAKEIVRNQHAFLDIGEAGMRPLKIRDVAQALDLHDSTVSRACARKYIMTPRGTYELKRFFSARIPNRSGNDESAEAIKYKIARLVEQESVTTPLSDQQITERLQRNGTEISRRTVAKYRADLRIPARSLRATLTINQLKREVV